LPSLLAVLAGLYGAPSLAQIGGRIGLQSDEVVRGVSVTQNRPIGSLDLSYDFPTGFYANGSTFGALSQSSRPGLVGLSGDVGYARRLNLQLSVDGGVARSQYIGVGSNGYSTGYTEVYAGLTSRHLSARLYYSPDYYANGSRTLYAEVGGNIGVIADIRLNAHVGTLQYLARPAGAWPAHTRFDWLIGASRQFGPADLHLAVTGGGPNQPSAYRLPRFGTRVVVGAGYTF
jgi:uncharacterized protein (TIGR02001 family)